MILLVNSNGDDVVIGDVNSVEVFGHERYVIIHSNNVDVYSELLDFGNYLFFFISSDNCIQITKRGYPRTVEWIKEGKSLKVHCSVIDSHYVSPGSYFGRIWKSYLRDKKLVDLLDK